MKKETLYVAFSTQKGGVGKTTFTVLVASYLYYLKEYNVAVVDCDYPQHSISAMRKRDAEQVNGDEYYKQLAFHQFKTLGKKAYPVLCSSPDEATNNTCKTLVRDHARHGTVVAANCQTAGKGRQGRTFVSPAGSGLYFSMILSEAVSLQDAPLLTACAAVAAARAIDALYGTQMQIKWVNDLYLDGKKCCGILTEGGVSLESGKLEHAIIGIGINVRNTSIAMPEELRHTVTSLEEARPDIHVCRAQLLATVLYEMEQVLRELPQRRFLAEYRSRSCLIGKTVELTKDDGTVKKVAVLEIADDCGLVVRDSFGNVETLHAGEVHIGAKGLQG